jgi:AraC-like DNA-binding protein
MKPLAYYLQIGTCVGSVYVGLVYIFYNWSRGLFHRLIGASFIVIAIGIMMSFVGINNYGASPTLLNIIGNIFILLAISLLYTSIFRGLLNKPFKKKDIYHLVPVLIYMINFLPNFLKKGSEKLAATNTEYLGTAQTSLLIPDHYLPIINLIQALLYIILFAKKTRQFKNNNVPETYIQLFYYFLAYLALYIITVLFIVFDYYELYKNENWIPIIYTLLNTLFFLKVISAPEWNFNKLEKDKRLEEADNLVNTEVLLNQIELKLTPSKTELNDVEQELLMRIIMLCEKNSLFLNVDFQQKNLAKDLNCSEYKLRILLEKAYGLNFVEYNNYLKIKYFLINYKKNNTWRLLKMVTISEMLGYKSLNSFYLNFKKITKITPGDFFKLHQY